MKNITLFILVNIMAGFAHASVSTPNMSLVQPTIGVDSGLTWEQATNSNSTIIDQHNHTPGYGVQIPPAGLNINSALTFANQQATNLQAILFNNQTSLATLNALYVINGELWYNDPTQPVQITSAGSVSATSSGITDNSGNSAAFVGGVLVVQNTSTAPDNIQAGSLLMGNVGTASSKYLTLNPPAAMGSNIAETFPTIPASTLPMVMSSSGNMSTQQIATAQIASGAVTTTQISASAGITGSQLANSTITTTQIAALGQQISSSSGNYTSTSGSFTAVTNLSVSITTLGHPVMLMLQTDGTTNNAVVLCSGSTAPVRCSGQFFRGSTGLGPQEIENIATPTGSNLVASAPPGAFDMMDTPSAGTYTYTFQVATALTTVSVSNIVLVAYEIR